MDEMETKAEDDEVSNWFKEIDLSIKRDGDWHKDADHANKTYRNERRIGSGDSKKRDTFNILWSNVETVRPALYSALPKPDIRRRFKDEDVLAMHVSEVLERATTYVLENSAFDGRMIDATNDLLLPGRGVTRIKYVPTMSEEVDEEGNEIEQVVESEDVEYEKIKWDQILLGPGDSWEELPWLAFEHYLDKEQVQQIAPEFADKIQYGHIASDNATQKDKEEDARVLKRARIYEIWDKTERVVRWVAYEFKDDFIAVEEDPLNLKDFWPIPKPCYAIESTTSLVPITDFSMYNSLADTLEITINREAKIASSLRVRGIYDSTMGEIEKLFEATDNAMIPAENLSRLIEKGGIDKALWMFPNETLVNVLLQLRQYRAEIIQQIYQLTGISDIQRGSSNAHETLGAQKIKANFGSQRLQRKQREIQRYARDLIRLTVEIIGENFSPKTLMSMTGLKYPTQEEKQQVEMQMQQAQMQFQQQQQQQPPPQPGQEPPQPPEMPPEMAEMMAKPTWEELKQVMADDVLRSYRIEIETDSTIQADQAADQEALALLMQSIAQFVQGLQPAIETGVLDKNAAKKLLSGFLKRFRLGREVEEAIMESQGGGEADQAQQQAQQQEQQAKQADQQAKQQEQQMKMQGIQAQTQASQAQAQADMQATQMEAQFKQAEHTQKMQELELKRQIAQEKFQQDMMKLKEQPNGK